MDKAKHAASAARAKTAEIIRRRRDDLERLLGKPNMMNELSFVTGLGCLLTLQAILFSNPREMAFYYTLLLFPLMCARYLLYRRDKFHFFMIDFCYYAQVLLLLQSWWYGPDKMFFFVVYALCTGPLGGGIYMWKNCLVLHDLDRFTSTFIHYVPLLVCYCLRYSDPRFMALELPEFWSLFWKSLMCYGWWQIMYILKTEILDRKRFVEDDKLVTSLRWMTNRKPHPIYKYVRSQPWGENIPGLLIIVVVQFVYTAVTIAPTYLFLRYKWLNEAWLILLFFISSWNGSRFYFEILAERALKEKKDAEPPKHTESVLVLYSSTRRFVTFAMWLALGLVGNKFMIERLVMVPL